MKISYQGSQQTMNTRPLKLDLDVGSDVRPNVRLAWTKWLPLGEQDTKQMFWNKAQTRIFYQKKWRHLTGWWIPERETVVSQSCAKRFSQLHLGRKGSQMKQRRGTKGGLCNAMRIVHVNENRILTFLFDRIPSAWASLNSPMARLPQSSTPTLWFNKLYTIEAKVFPRIKLCLRSFKVELKFDECFVTFWQFFRTLIINFCNHVPLATFFCLKNNNNRIPVPFIWITITTVSFFCLNNNNNDIFFIFHKLSHKLLLPSYPERA